MIKGIVTCKCGQTFGFESIAENVSCPECGAMFIASAYATVDETETEEFVEVVDEPDI